MALAKQLLPLSYGGGLDTKTDPASVPLGKWLVLENAIFTKPGSLHKRNGFASLAAGILGGGSVAAGTTLAPRSNELVLSDGANLYSYDSPNTSWVNKGGLPGATLASIAAVGNQNSLRGYDTALHSSGLQIIVAEQIDETGPGLVDLVYSIVDTLTGQIVVPPTTVDVAANLPGSPKVCVLGNFFLIFWLDTFHAPVVMYCQAIAISAPQTLVYGARQAVTSGVTTSAIGGFRQYDVTVSNGTAYVAFGDNVSTVGIFGITAASPYTQSLSTLGVNPGTAPQAICICGNSFNNDVVVGVTRSDTTATAFAYSANLSSQTKAPTTIDTQAAGFASIAAISTSSAATAIQFYIGWGQGFVDACYIRQNTFGASYSVGTASTPARSLKPAAKPILYSGASYLPTWLTGPGAVIPTLQSTWVLIDSSGRAVAKAFAGTAAGYAAYNKSWNSTGSKYAMLPESPLVSGGKFNTPIGNTLRTSVNTAGVISVAWYAVVLAQLNLADTVNRHTRAQLGAVVLFSGAAAQMYDGATAVEQGFLYYPEIQSLVNAAGGVMSAGTYQYIVVYEWQDADGQRHQSTPGPAKSIVVAANEKVTLTIPTLRLTTKANVLINIYKTIANGLIFYKHSNIFAASATTLVNSTSVDTVTFIDNFHTDAALINYPQLYTTGGTLQAAAPPPLNSVIVHRSRVFGIDPTTGQLAYTKQYIPGSTGQPIEFSGFLTMNADNRGGNPTALASLDEKLIIFKSDRVFMVLGQGPDATGANNDFSDAVLVSSDTGCSAPKSIVIMPDGIMFKSPKGFYLLDRALRVSYIGAPAEAYNSANVTSANLIPSTNQVRFTLDSGVALVYDYRADQWGTFTNINATDATIWQGNFVYLTAAGIANQETPGVFSDPGSTFIAMKAVSPWIQLAQVQGFQRVYKVLVLGQYVSAHKLRVKLAYDFSTSFAQTDDITVSSNPAPYQYRVHCAKQKCEALQISVEDVSTGTIGEALSLSGLTLDAGVKRGLFRMPASKSFG